MTTAPETTSVASEVLTEMSQLHLRTIASPLPVGAALGWQMVTSATAALAVRLLHDLIQTDPQRAEELAGWYSRLADNGGALMGVVPWIQHHVAEPAGEDVEVWIDEARELAEQAKAATDALTKES